MECLGEDDDYDDDSISIGNEEEDENWISTIEEINETVVEDYAPLVLEDFDLESSLTSPDQVVPTESTVEKVIAIATKEPIQNEEQSTTIELPTKSATASLAATIIPTTNQCATPAVQVPQKNDKRTRLFQYFSGRLAEKDERWNPLSKLPRRGKDFVFDDIMTKLFLDDKKGRAYAAAQWLKFKKTKNLRGDKLRNTQKDILNEYAGRISQCDCNAIVHGAVEELMNYGFDDFVVPVHALVSMKTFCESDICSDLLKDLINSFNNNLSTTLAGASVANLAARLIASDLVVMKLRDTFLGMVQTQLLDNQPNLQVQSVNIYFSRLFTIMNNHWEKSIRVGGRPHLLADIDSTMVNDFVHGTEHIVYYISGFLLHRIERCQAGDELKTRQTFVSFNSLSVTQARTAKLPTTKIDKREYKEGALKRSNDGWYWFVCLLESTFVANLTARNAMYHRGNLFLEIGVALRKSKSLQSTFQQCFPPCFTEEDKNIMWRSYYHELLRSFLLLRSKDTKFILLERKRRNAPRDSDQSRLNLRTKLVAVSKKQD